MGTFVDGTRRASSRDDTVKKDMGESFGLDQELRLKYPEAEGCVLLLNRSSARYLYVGSFKLDRQEDRGSYV